MASNADKKSRARVQRLLSGAFRPDDLTNLFLYARDHCDGRQHVAEIGHFVAHHQERNKGLVTRVTRAWFATVRYMLPPRDLIDGDALPSSARDYFKCAADQTDSIKLRSETGLSRSKARSVLKSLSERLTKNSDGTWRLPKTITHSELRLVHCVSTTMLVEPAFDAGELTEGFVATLRSNGLISKQEDIDHHKYLGVIVPLFAVSVMHHCIVQVGDGTNCVLTGSSGDGQILVTAAVPITLYERQIKFSKSIFSADIDPSIYCHPDLQVGKEWDFDIELSTDGQLVPLR